VAFACCQLKGFEIDPPPHPPSLASPFAVSEEVGEGKGTNKGNDCSFDDDHSLSDLRRSLQTTRNSRGATSENKTFSLGLPFDKFRIGQRVLDTSVREVLFFHYAALHLDVYDYRLASPTMPQLFRSALVQFIG
jgi:hypothetical protein